LLARLRLIKQTLCGKKSATQSLQYSKIQNTNMKSKLLILSLLMIIGMASCRRQQCPAYGKATPKAAIEKRHA
jgi:hypothetical protein